MRKRHVIVMRHGETDWNVAGRFQGHSDIPLNAVGREQVSRAADWLAGEPIHHVISSDLQRARDSAHPTAQKLGLEVHADAALRERSYGILEGMTWGEIELRHPDIYVRLRQSARHVDVPGGESPEALKDRTWPALVRAASRATSSDAVLVVTHGGVMRNWLVDWLGDAAPRPVPNAVPFRFTFVQEAVTRVERMDAPGLFSTLWDQPQ